MCEGACLAQATDRFRARPWTLTQAQHSFRATFRGLGFHATLWSHCHFLHWAIAALLAFQIAVGGALEDLGAPLTLKGVARPQTIRFTLSGTGKARKVSGSATIARAPFGVGNGESSAGLDPKVAVSFAFHAKAE